MIINIMYTQHVVSTLYKSHRKLGHFKEQHYKNVSGPDAVQSHVPIVLNDMMSFQIFVTRETLLELNPGLFCLFVVMNTSSS